MRLNKTGMKPVDIFRPAEAAINTIIGENRRKKSEYAFWKR